MESPAPPLRHLSIRVPWHDTAWDGRVCARPSLNAACLKLKRIAQQRVDKDENAVHDRPWNELGEANRPCCVAERAGFMAPWEYIRTARHPYNHNGKGTHAHIQETALRHPPYSAAIVPFAWMLRASMEKIGREHDLDVREDREPDYGFGKTWIQNHLNQRAVLEGFASHLREGLSLCFFYAKAVPFVEDPGSRRILIGVGRLRHKGGLREYEYDRKIAELGDRPRSLLWERMVQHSIRPDFKDGFLLPYHRLLEVAAGDPAMNVEAFAAFSPEDRMPEFSHASQLVTPDGAIAALLACAESLRKATKIVGGQWTHCLEWLDQRLGELWKARGPCPGLGAALSAFGLEAGTFIARALVERAGENVDPWPLVNAMFIDPARHLPAPLADSVDPSQSKAWSRLPQDRRALLKLTSRFELTGDQARLAFQPEAREEARLGFSDADLLANPYLLYETTRLTDDPVSVWTVDRGVFPDPVIREAHPLPAPSRLKTGTDARRIRAWTVKVLEDAAADGSTLLPQSLVVTGISAQELDPPCCATGDIMNAVREEFGDAVADARMADGSPALQLTRLQAIANAIRLPVKRRRTAERHVVAADWRKLLDNHLRVQQESVGIPVPKSDEAEEDARREKTAALKVMAEARLSVLIGSAGTGKTTLLSVLCGHPAIASGGILLLAPTGKARVRMEQATRTLKLQGQTIAQFLAPHRYDGTTSRYRLSGVEIDPGADTAIIDEASMLTEEMLGALFQALRKVPRIILIGDPRQLPPIGAGRPFVDIVRELTPPDIGGRFPKIDANYAELTIRRRQLGQMWSRREDLQLAEWFSGAAVAPDEDQIFDVSGISGGDGTVQFEQWDTEEELRAKLVETVVRELGLRDADDLAGFDQTFGARSYDEENSPRFFNLGSAENVESWQILSPIRASAAGVPAINRYVHKHFRREQLKAAHLPKHCRKIPEPMGAEEIVYGDKVINLVNTDPASRRFKHRQVFPEKNGAFIANGEIGLVVGYYWKKDTYDFRWKLKVEFSSQPGFEYDFTSSKDFKDEASPILELAYALTVHKAQGSEFKKVILVLPNPCRLLSRELLYTALTRQREKVVILHQGPRTALRRFASDDRSETARRLTNLFTAPAPVLIEGRFFEESLIHRTGRGEMVRSKSEVIVADRLSDAGVDYTYEKSLALGGQIRYPDFTIDDAESGRTYYWEHCGMLHMPSYEKRWKEKLRWYNDHGIQEYHRDHCPTGKLLVSRDEPDGSIDSEQIKHLIVEVFVGG